MADQKITCQICGSKIKNNTKNVWAHNQTKRHKIALQTGKKYEPRSTQTRLEYYKEKNAERKQKILEEKTPDELREIERIRRQKNRLALKALQEPDDGESSSDDDDSKHDDSKRDLPKQVPKESQSKNVNKVLKQFTDQLRLDVHNTLKKGSNLSMNASVMEEKKQQLTSELARVTNKDDLMKVIYERLVERNKILKKPQPSMKNAVQVIGDISRLYEYMFKKKFDYTSFDWLRDTDAVYKAVWANDKWAGHGNVTKVKYFIAPAVILRNEKGFEKEQLFYSKLGTNLKDSYKELNNLNQLNPREEGVAMKWSQIQHVALKIPENETRERAVHAIYTLIPPRRLMDYEMLKVVRGKNDDYVNKLPETFNYIIFDHKGTVRKIIINEFKGHAKHKYGTYILHSNDIPNKLKKILKRYRRDKEINNGDFLFGQRSDMSKQNTNFNMEITDIFKRYANVSAGVNILRHAYASMFLSKYRTEATVKKIAFDMGTSPEELRRYVRQELLEKN